MARRELVIALLLALSASWRCVVAYPPLWLAEDEAVESCVAHPAKPEGPHGAPVKDKCVAALLLTNVLLKPNAWFLTAAVTAAASTSTRSCPVCCLRGCIRAPVACLQGDDVCGDGSWLGRARQGRLPWWQVQGGADMSADSDTACCPSCSMPACTSGLTDTLAQVALDFGSGEKSSRRVLLTSSVGNFTRATPGW